MASMVWTGTVLHQDRTDHGKKVVQASLQGSSGTYLAGGISVTGTSLTGQMGLPYGNLEQLNVIDSNGDGYIYQWNKTNGTIQMFECPTTSTIGVAKLTEVTSSVSPSSTITVEVIGW